MDILFLTQILPYPPDAGPKIKTWNVLRYFVKKGYRVTLVSFIREEEEQYLAAVQREGIYLYPVPIRRSRIKDGIYWLLSIITGIPFLIARDNLPEMRKLVMKLIQDQKYDVVHADQITMTQFVPIHGEEKYITIFDAHNATYSIVERMQKTSIWFLKPVLALEATRLKKYEASLVKDFDYTLAVTSLDRQLLAEACGEDAKSIVEDRIKVIPIAVDTDGMRPIQRVVNSHNIVTLGTLHYPPNADGIRWFIREVFPKIKNRVEDVTLTIIGKNPPEDFLKISDHSGGAIKVTGYVKELEPVLHEAALMVVPVRAGSGMRVRILEAFSRGMPVVTTTIGLEGIEARVGEDVLVSDQANGFADEVVHLLEDPNLQSCLALNGRKLAEQLYDWRSVLKKLDEIYDSD